MRPRFRRFGKSRRERGLRRLPAGRCVPTRGSTPVVVATALQRSQFLQAGFGTRMNVQQGAPRTLPCTGQALLSLQLSPAANLAAEPAGPARSACSHATGQNGQHVTRYPIPGAATALPKHQAPSHDVGEETWVAVPRAASRQRRYAQKGLGHGAAGAGAVSGSQSS